MTDSNLVSSTLPYYIEAMYNNSGNVEEIVFDSNYRQTLQKLEYAASKQDFSIEDVRNELETLYRYEGLDWTGRGNIKHSEIGGAILAYQVFIGKWNKADDRKKQQGDS